MQKPDRHLGWINSPLWLLGVGIVGIVCGAFGLGLEMAAVARNLHGGDPSLVTQHEQTAVLFGINVVINIGLILRSAYRIHNARAAALAA